MTLDPDAKWRWPMGRAFRSSVLAWSAALSAAMSAAALAETSGPYRPPPVGTEFVVSDTAWFRVIGAGDGAVTIKDAAGATTTWLAGLVTRDMPPEDRARLMGAFPLAPGTRLEYGARWAAAGAHRELAVIADDVVQVDGRAVPVLRVIRYQVDTTPIPAEGEYTLWFAPEYGFPLKMTYRHIAGEPPKFVDWQIAHVVPPPGIHGAATVAVDGVWRFSVECSNGTFWRMGRAVVRNGVIVNAVGDHPDANSPTEADFRLSRTGDQLELTGTMTNASGGHVIVAARATLSGDTAAGLATLSSRVSVRSGCPFTAARQ
jgi:hypothetical protein